MVKQSLEDTLIQEVYSEPLEKSYETNKTVVKHVNNTCGLEILDLINDGTRNKKGYRSISVVIDNFSDQRWSIQLKSETSKALTKEDSNIINISNRKPSPIETDDRKEFRNEIFTELLNSKDVEIFSSYT